MSWYSLRQLAKELGMAPNTFKILFGGFPARSRVQNL